MTFARITIDPKQMGGTPCIRSLRIPVATVVGQLAENTTIEEILRDYPDLEADDIQACLAYAHAVIAHDSLDSIGAVAH